MKADELRTLDAEELSSRLKGARRELYELRFKLAVGQLDDHRQIRKVRKDIARILTVVHRRRLAGTLDSGEPDVLAGEEAAATGSGAAAEVVEAEEPAAAADGGQSEETPENVETAETPSDQAPARKTRRRRAAGEEGND